MPSPSPSDKRASFAALHRGPDLFIAPNAWDAGTARILTSLGFPALATTSAGLAMALGVRDSSAAISRAAVLANARDIVAATDLPVSADLEDGFGPTPEDVAETVRQATDVGLAGGAIEDATGDDSNPIYDIDTAVARIRAAVAAKTDPGFLITARSENFLFGRPDLADTIRRLQAFEAAGADVLYAPGLPDIAAVHAVCAAVTAPVNVLIGITTTPYTVADLAAAGVRRVSTGGSLARAALGAVVRGATELRDHGSVGYIADAMPGAQIMSQMRDVKRT
ncbi:MAG: isocitrate lyase/phosphoenolpyruvate mutase family protein [Pseudomonadota bacterium]